MSIPTSSSSALDAVDWSSAKVDGHPAVSGSDEVDQVELAQLSQLQATYAHALTTSSSEASFGVTDADADNSGLKTDVDKAGWRLSPKMRKVMWASVAVLIAAVGGLLLWRLALSNSLDDAASNPAGSGFQGTRIQCALAFRVTARVCLQSDCYEFELTLYRCHVMQAPRAVKTPTVTIAIATRRTRVTDLQAVRSPCSSLWVCLEPSLLFRLVWPPNTL